MASIFVQRLALVRQVVLILFVASIGVAHAQPPSFRDGEVPRGQVETIAPAIDLYTFGVGGRIFEKYGHATLCLRYHDPRLKTVCFNYGVTDFSQGGMMVWNFLRTKQLFWGEFIPLRGMLGFYRWEDRDIYRQTLPLSEEEARSVEAQLWRSVEPAHLYYVYDHFFNNCTTRLRDMIDEATKGKLRAGNQRPFGQTFRMIGERGLYELPYLIAGADFVLGRQLDDMASVWDAMFHPDVLRREVTRVFGVEPELIYARRGAPFPTTGSTGRLWYVLVAFAFALPLLLARLVGRGQRLALALAVLPLTLWGLIIWGGAILSTIVGVRYNEILMILVPFDVFLPVLRPAWRQRYARGRLLMVLLATVLAAVGVFHQPVWVPALTAFLPLVMEAFDFPRRRA